jgi:hypothetical protein
LEVSVATYAQERIATNTAFDNLKSIDVVLGGDHGQGKFGSVIKIILRDGAGLSVDTLVMKVEHNDCTKYTYDVLKSSVAGPLNDLLKEVINSGALQVIRDENGSIVFQIKR